MDGTLYALARIPLTRFSNPLSIPDKARGQMSILVLEGVLRCAATSLSVSGVTAVLLKPSGYVKLFVPRDWQPFAHPFK